MVYNNVPSVVYSNETALVFNNLLQWNPPRKLSTRGIVFHTLTHTHTHTYTYTRARAHTHTHLHTHTHTHTRTHNTHARAHTRTYTYICRYTADTGHHPNVEEFARQCPVDEMPKKVSFVFFVDVQRQRLFFFLVLLPVSDVNVFSFFVFTLAVSDVNVFLCAPLSIMVLLIVRMKA